MMDEEQKLKELLHILGSKIRERRKVLGLTQEQLAELAGISVNFLARMEMTARTPSFDTLVRIADALGVEVSDLLRSEASVDQLNNARDIAYCLGLLSPSQADFVMEQMRTTTNFLRNTNADKSPKHK